MNKITVYRRGGVHPRPYGCNHQGVGRSARDSGQPQGIAPTVFAWNRGKSKPATPRFRFTSSRLLATDCTQSKGLVKYE